MNSHRKHETFSNDCYYDIEGTKKKSFGTKKVKRFLTTFKFMVREFTRNLARPLKVALLRYTKTEGVGNPYRPVLIKDGVAYLNFHAVDNVSDVGQNEKSSMHLHNQTIAMLFGIYNSLQESYPDPNVAKDFLRVVRENWATASTTCINILRGSGKQLEEVLEKNNLDFINEPKIAENISVLESEAETEEEEEIVDDTGNVEDESEWDVTETETEEQGDETDGEEEPIAEIDWGLD